MLFRRPDVISGTIAYGANGKEASEVQTAWRFLPQEKGETPCRAASSVGDRRERKKERKKKKPVIWPRGRKQLSIRTHQSACYM